MFRVVDGKKVRSRKVMLPVVACSWDQVSWRSVNLFNFFWWRDGCKLTAMAARKIYDVSELWSVSVFT